MHSIVLKTSMVTTWFCLLCNYSKDILYAIYLWRLEIFYWSNNIFRQRTVNCMQLSMWNRAQAVSCSTRPPVQYTCGDSVFHQSITYILPTAWPHICVWQKVRLHWQFSWQFLLLRSDSWQCYVTITLGILNQRYMVLNKYYQLNIGLN